MEEKEKVEAATLEEEKELSQEEEEAAIHWKTKSNRQIWLPEEGEEKAPVEQTPEDEEEARLVLEEARKRAEEVPEEEMHPAYKKMVGIGTAASADAEDESDEVPHAKCGECGALVPYTDLHDNGSYVVCSKCY